MLGIDFRVSRILIAAVLALRGFHSLSRLITPFLAGMEVVNSI
jgi:hypothetical protein